MAKTSTTPLLLLVAASMLLFGCGAPLASGASSITVEKSAYKNVVIEIRDNVPVDNCQTILQNLEPPAHQCRSQMCMPNVCSPVARVEFRTQNANTNLPPHGGEYRDRKSY
uniref:Uncharacterized protein n=1 Tax=Anopheles farauti TaxID=69004 RepID=A0A182Q1P2_9DIPT